MIRQILCIDCGLRVKPDPEDTKFGWEQRKVRGLSRQPNLLCDRCFVQLKEGSPVVAITKWRHEDPPEHWEPEYLTPAS